jgi:hypothetical protein
MSLCKSTARAAGMIQNVLLNVLASIFPLVVRMPWEKALLVPGLPTFTVPYWPLTPGEEVSTAQHSQAKLTGRGTWLQVPGTCPSLAFNSNASKNEVKSALQHCRKTKTLNFKREVKFVYEPH